MQRLGDSGTLGVGETTIASAATTNLSASKTRDILISGTTTITSFGITPNRDYRLRFSGALTLTYNATSLITPTLANVVTAAGDTAIVESDVSGNWRITAYQRANGAPLMSGPNLLTYAGAQPALGYTPVQQGGGTNQASNKIYVGWSGSDLLAQVDTTNLGKIFTDTNSAGSIDGSTGYFIQRFPSGVIIILGSSAITTNASGVARINTGVTSSTGAWVAIVSNGDSGASSSYPVVTSPDTTGFSIYMANAASLTVRVNWIAAARWK